MGYQGFSQYEIKRTIRPDSLVIEYIDPKPVVRASDYEAAISIYKFTNEQDLMINLSVLFKGLTPNIQSGNLIIQTTNDIGISLKPYQVDLIQMNERDVAVGLYHIDSISRKELSIYPIKALFFHLGDKRYGSNLTENRNTLMFQIAKFEGRSPSRLDLSFDNDKISSKSKSKSKDISTAVLIIIVFVIIIAFVINHALKKDKKERQQENLINNLGESENEEERFKEEYLTLIKQLLIDNLKNELESSPLRGSPLEGMEAVRVLGEHAKLLKENFEFVSSITGGSEITDQYIIDEIVLKAHSEVYKEIIDI